MEIKSNAKKQIKALYESVRRSGYEVTGLEEKQYNYEFSAIKNNTKNKIQVFFGKKGIKTVIQGINTSSEYAELQNISSENYSFNFAKEEIKDYVEYIGTDETGKGDFFGPLVVAGFFTDERTKDFLLRSDVRDSKEITDYSINKIAKKICSKFPENYYVISISPERYNSLYEKLKNINEILSWAHSKVIKELYNSHKTATVIIDQFKKKDLDITYSDEFSEVEFLQIPKAEKYIGVAAASIIARHHLNKWFDRMNFNKFNLPKGASSKVESAARNLVEKVGKDNLGKFAKLHFKTTKKIFDN